MKCRLKLILIIITLFGNWLRKIMLRWNFIYFFKVLVCVLFFLFVGIDFFWDLQQTWPIINHNFVILNLIYLWIRLSILRIQVCFYFPKEMLRVSVIVAVVSCCTTKPTTNILRISLILVNLLHRVFKAWVLNGGTLETIYFVDFNVRTLIVDRWRDLA